MGLKVSCQKRPVAAAIGFGISRLQFLHPSSPRSPSPPRSPRTSVGLPRLLRPRGLTGDLVPAGSEKNKERRGLGDTTTGGEGRELKRFPSLHPATVAAARRSA
ncbi:hypothetical protein EJB05_10896 [Eragrostis curvula]|uniref:Uncharacterized protein n=1 Tax=Eragrostis curvula TaxID=38414 RepID=A0A5J9VQ74_9POAL|nr:hypothetical protein EJB05_10896 [Eragrostis curvula]